MENYKTDKSNYEIKPLAWDTAFFGVPCARLTLYEALSEGAFAQAMKALREYRFVTIANEGDCHANNYLIGARTHAFLTDVNIHLRKSITGAEQAEGAPRVAVSNALEYDGGAVLLAQKSFVHSRFLNDPHLSKELAEQLYKNWVSSSFGREDKFFAVCREAGKTLGFILFREAPTEQSAVVELIAVSGERRGEGVGSALMRSLDAHCVKRRLTSIRLGTQADNRGALNFYHKNGFCNHCVSYIYHLWQPAAGQK